MSFLGLPSGFTAFFAQAPRAALNAHTIGILQGAMLFGLVGAWHLFRVSPRMFQTIKCTLLVGLYANWLGAELAGLWSSGRDMFIAQNAALMPAGAAPWMNLTVTVLLNISGLILVSWISDVVVGSPGVSEVTEHCGPCRPATAQTRGRVGVHAQGASALARRGICGA